MTQDSRARNPRPRVAGDDAITRQLTRGFLFADLRGYTSFVDTHGARQAADLVSRFRSLVREEVDRFAGAEIRTEGDSFFVVFPSASAALGCALEIGRMADTPGTGDPIRVGIGVHAGEAVDLDGDFVGSAV